MQQALTESIEELAQQYPNSWGLFVAEAPEQIPFIFDHEGSVRWFLAQKKRTAPYVEAGALRKEGKRWVWNPQRFVRAWEQQNPATH